MQDLITKLSSSSQQHKAAWKKLLKQMQLPRKLGLFASSKLVSDPGVTGTWLLPVFTEAVGTLLGAAQRDCMPSVQAEMFQQMGSSGLFKTLDQLKAATAAQLEQSGAATTAAAAAGGDLATLWHTAGALMGVQAHMNEILDKDPSLEDSMPVESRSSSTAVTHQLLLAVVKHISLVLPQYDKQAAPPQDLVFLAYNLSVFATNKAAEVCGLKKQSPSALAAGRQHDTAWANISLLLLAHAWTLRLSDPQNYSAVFGNSSSSSNSSSDAVAAPTGSDAKAKSAKSAATKIGPAAGAAWQLVQSEWQHVPAAHEQLLGSFGISAQAGLWVAAVMSHLKLHSLTACWTAVLHLSAGKQAACGAGAGSGADSAAELCVFWQAQAAGIGRALEEYVRGEDSPQLTHVGEMCSSMCESLARHGSSEQRLALFRLLVSLLKRSHDCPLDPRGEVPTAVAKAAFDMLAHTPAARAASNSVAGSVTLASDAQVVSGGLWLLVFGRCCLQWAAAVQRPMAAGKLKAALGIAKLSEGRDMDLARPWNDLEFGLMQQMVVMHELEDWLGSEGGKSACAELSAAGYAMGSVVEGARALADTYGKMNQAVAGCFFGHAVYADVLTAKASGLVGELTSLGQALSVFAVRFCCNNPWCPNTSGMSEKAVVTGKSCLCAGCKVARYCCKTCQTACWESVHKPVCKMLRARSAAKA